MIRVHRLAVAVAVSILVVAGAIALTAAARSGDQDCETLRDARQPVAGRVVCGAFLDRYRAEGGRSGLGLPVSDERDVLLESARPYGDREMAFSRGTIYLNSATGETSVGRWDSYAPLN